MQSVQTFLDSLDLPENQAQNLYTRFLSLRNEAEEIANCDHENAYATVNPQTMERPLSDTLDPNEEGTQAVFHANCEDCNADLSAILSLTIDRGDAE